jgi:hypothetical protein
VEVTTAREAARCDQLDGLFCASPLFLISCATQCVEIWCVIAAKLVISGDQLHRYQVPDPRDRHLLLQDREDLRLGDDLCLDSSRREQ